MIQTQTLLPGITLRCCRDERFKQGCLSIQFVRQMRQEESALNALLPNVLLRGTRTCPNLRAITDRLDALYGAAMAPTVRRVGDRQTTGLYCSFMDDRFALPGDRVMEPVLSFLEEILLDPLLEGGVFLPAFVESEKRNLIATIESEGNDKRVYAMNQLLKMMCAGDTFGLPRLGEPEAVEAIDPAGLYRHYRQVLRTSPVEIFYVGSAPADQVARMLAPLVGRLERCCQSLPPQTGLQASPGGVRTERMDVAQGKLCMGFITPVTNRDPAFPAMQVLTSIFGGGMTSKLFTQVREKLSLCYSIGATYFGTKGIVVVSAGIDFDKEDLTREKILEQLAACQAGDITAEELSAAKEALLSSLRAVHDSPGAMESYYATAAISGLGLTPQGYMEAVRQVTLEDITAAAGQVSIHSTYFLKGESQ